MESRWDSGTNWFWLVAFRELVRPHAVDSLKPRDAAPTELDGMADVILQIGRSYGAWGGLGFKRPDSRCGEQKHHTEAQRRRGGGLVFWRTCPRVVRRTTPGWISLSLSALLARLCYALSTDHAMQPKRIALVLAIGFFVFWLGVLYAGADHPPPAGFAWGILLDAVAGWLVYIRTPTYIQWAQVRLPYRRVRAMLDGAGVGVLFATIALLLPGNGEPGVHPHLQDRVIWYAILAMVGVMNGASLYLLSAAAAKRIATSKPLPQSTNSQ
jgi:hypothetical protein